MTVVGFLKISTSSEDRLKLGSLHGVLSLPAATYSILTFWIQPELGLGFGAHQQTVNFVSQEENFSNSPNAYA